MFATQNRKSVCVLLVVLTVFLFISTEQSSAQLSGFEVIIEQLHLFNMADSVFYSQMAMITLFYSPDILDFYVNVVALDNTQQPQWIVRNLYIPDNSWIDTEQMISTRFDMQLLGVPVGEDVPALNIAIFSTEHVMDRMPDVQEYVPVVRPGRAMTTPAIIRPGAG